jgi:hypothetical protein
MNLQSEKIITIHLPIYFEKVKRETKKKGKQRAMFTYKIFLHDGLCAEIPLIP